VLSVVVVVGVVVVGWEIKSFDENIKIDRHVTSQQQQQNTIFRMITNESLRLCVCVELFSKWWWRLKIAKENVWQASSSSSNNNNNKRHIRSFVRFFVLFVPNTKIDYEIKNCVVGYGML